MIDFDEELTKFQPILELEEVQESIQNDNFNDLSDLLINMLNKNEIYRNDNQRAGNRK